MSINITKDKRVPINPQTYDERLKQLNHAAEGLITGDSDDPPLNDDMVSEMLKTTQND